MIARRTTPSWRSSHRCSPVSSGPRCWIVASMRRITEASGRGLGPTRRIPTNPHMVSVPSRATVRDPGSRSRGGDGAGSGGPTRSPVPPALRHERSPCATAFPHLWFPFGKGGGGSMGGKHDVGRLLLALALALGGVAGAHAGEAQPTAIEVVERVNARSEGIALRRRVRM